MQFNTLPGECTPYCIRNGQGPRHLVGGMVASAYATGHETNGAFCLTVLTGGKDAGLPLLRHAVSHTGIFVLEGVLEATLGDGTWRMERGDYASIPPGTVYGFRMDRHRTVVIAFQTGADAGRLYSAWGIPFAGHVQPETNAGSAADLVARSAPASCDTQVLGGLPIASELRRPRCDLPHGVEPYVIEAGEGDRLVVADQLFTFAGCNRQTGGSFLTLLNEGPAGQMIPPHKHMKHDEMFFCVDGTMRMMAGEETLELGPGDFLFVPRDTPHAYQFCGTYNRTLGWLVPGVFEPFFRTLGDSYSGHVYPQEPAAFRFDRVMAKINELDIVPLGAPPQASRDGKAVLA